MNILVDMDGVICEWDAAYDEALDLHGDAAANIPRTAERTAFNLNEGRTPAEKRIIKQIMCQPGFYAELRPIYGARAALKEMIALGHDVRLVTSPWASNPTCASDKLNWVRRHIGESWAARTVITNDKTLVVGDVLIDDRPSVTGHYKPKWKHVLFDRPYNQDVNKPRITRWSEWREVLGA